MSQVPTNGFSQSPTVKLRYSKRGLRFLSECRTIKAKPALQAEPVETQLSEPIEIPNNIQAEHWREWLASGVDSEIIALNVRSLSGTIPYDYLFYSEKLERRNDGRVVESILKRYRHIESGGWWCAGVDVLTFKESLWGQFKPNSQRLDSDGKLVKYEAPPKIPTEIFALRIPVAIFQLVARRYDVALPENYRDVVEKPEIFWQWVIQHPQIPIIIGEGAKKAAAVLGCGYVMISLPGVTNGLRQPKDEFGEPTESASLIQQLQVFAQLGRRIYFCFDSDSKRRTIRNVNEAIGKRAKLFLREGCEVKIITWNPILGKGVDDLIVAYGQEQFDELYCNASSFDQWQTQQLKRLTYSVDLKLNQRYLGEFMPPANKQLICLKAPKGTGKTEWLSYITDPVIRSRGKRILLLTHLVQLSTQTANRLGIPYITQVAEEGTYFGMGMCIDSLHPKSQARFNPDEWKGCWLIIDEVQQVVWHLLNSKTCQNQRVAIIKTLKQLLRNIINHGGKIFIADADLNDISIDFIKSLIGFDIDPWIVENEYQFQRPWNIYQFNGSTPSQMVKLLQSRLELGEKHLLCVSGQKAKSKWGSRNLEAYFKKKIPSLTILRVDSETVSDPNHPAFGCVGNLNEVVRDSEWWSTHTCPVNACPIDQSITPEIINTEPKQLSTKGEQLSVQQVYPHCELYPKIEVRERRDYDLVIASPTIQTGVSIEVPHFDGVWGIFQGVQSPDSVRQHLSRYRVPVPRYIWLKGVGINRVGNGSASVKSLLAGEYSKDKANVKRLLDIGFEETIDGNFEPTCITTWAKMAALVNLGMSNYAEQIIEDLASEGHQIYDAQTEGIFADDEELIDLPDESESEVLKEEITQTRNGEYLKHRESVAAAESIADEKYERLSRQQCKTQTEQLEYRKGELDRLYAVEVTPKLVGQDDNNWYSQIRLHYYFDDGRNYLSEREKNIMSSALLNGDKDYFKPDTNNKFIGKKIDALDWLGFDRLFENREFSNQDPVIQEIFDKCMEPKNFRSIKLVLGIDLSNEQYPMSLCQRLVGLIGYRFPCLRREGSRDQRVRIYGRPAADFLRDEESGKFVLDDDGRAIPIPDGRAEVFASWLARDAAAVEKAVAEKLAAQKKPSITDEDEWLKPETLASMAKDFQSCENSLELQTWFELCPAYAVEEAAKLLPMEFGQWVLDWLHWWKAENPNRHYPTAA